MSTHSVPGFRNPGATPADTQSRMDDQQSRVVILAERGRGVRPGSLLAINGRRTDYRDAAMQGLILRVSPPNDGAKESVRTWCVWYRVGPKNNKLARRLTLGRYPELSLAAAREEAAKVRADAKKGVDAWAERKAAEEKARKARLVGETVRDLGERFLLRHATTLAERTLYEYKRILALNVYPEIGTLPPSAVGRAHIRALTEKVAERAGVQANRTLALLHRLFAWALEVDLLSVNPCGNVKKLTDEKPRERVYTNEELRAVFGAVGGTEVADLVPFIAYTGVRSEEARSAQWIEIDLDRALWTIADTKEGKPHLVCLSPGALRVIASIEREGPFLFSAPTREGFMDPPQKAIETVRERSGVADFRLHDLRRTVRTRLPGLGVTPDVAERVLGHALPGMRKVYDQYDYLPQTRRALEAWSAELDRILNSEERAGADVLAFGRKG
jgi:integrase